MILMAYFEALLLKFINIEYEKCSFTEKCLPLTDVNKILNVEIFHYADCKYN